MPELPKEIIAESLRALSSRDIVVGPSSDGGYYLLGMKKFIPRLFENIPWRSPDVFGRTLQTIAALGLTYHQLPMLPDIDTKDDIRRQSIIADRHNGEFEDSPVTIPLQERA